MAIKSILFGSEMIRAILEGHKICTRRKIDKDISNRFDVDSDGKVVAYIEQATGDSYKPEVMCKYQPGDILYVRETWDYLEGWKIGDSGIAGQYFYRADGDHRPVSWRGPWQSSVHMSREAARIWLLVTDVQAERLQNITVEDIKNEGITDDYKTYSQEYLENLRTVSYPKVFAAIWDSAIKKSDRDCYGWAANPWVWKITFQVCDKPEEK